MLLGTRRALLGRKGQNAAAAYRAKVLVTNPIAYWPLGEISGTAAVNLVNATMNGTYARDVSVMTTAAGPLGDTAPVFGGAADFVNIYSAAFNSAFNGATGTAMIWMRVANAGVWTDGGIRNLFNLRKATTDLYQIVKRNTLNLLRGGGIAGSGAATVDYTPFSSVAWVPAAITWSDQNNADEFKFFVNGVQVGATGTELGVHWAAGALDVSRTMIGAISTTTGFFHGCLAHMIVWNTVLAPSVLADLAH
jgi:hypothetical protein